MKRLWIALLLASSFGCQSDTPAKASGPRVIVLGFDGMDYGLTKRLMDEGRMPNFSKVAAEGSFGPLETSVPPQSPVAWSNFITGMDSGGHGIYDFVHRTPETMLPYLSTTQTSEGGESITIGKYQFPLSGGSTELMRKGRAFWEVLEARGIESTVVPKGVGTRFVREPERWPRRPEVRSCRSAPNSSIAYRSDIESNAVFRPRTTASSSASLSSAWLGRFSVVAVVTAFATAPATKFVRCWMGAVLSASSFMGVSSPSVAAEGCSFRA